jgi:hypothetical protein
MNKFQPLHSIIKKTEIVLASTPFLVNLYCGLFKYQIRLEIEHSHIDSNMRVLFVGGGPVPKSAIRIAKETGAVVDVIDNWSEGTTLARKTIERLGLQAKINILPGDGLSFPIKSYKIIFIATHVVPFNEILTRMIRDTEEGTCIIFRKPAAVFTYLYSHANKNAAFYEVKEIVCPRLQTFHSYIIKTNRSPIIN